MVQTAEHTTEKHVRQTLRKFQDNLRNGMGLKVSGLLWYTSNEILTADLHNGTFTMRNTPLRRIKRMLGADEGITP